MLSGMDELKLCADRVLAASLTLPKSSSSLGARVLLASVRVVSQSDSLEEAFELMLVSLFVLDAELTGPTLLLPLSMLNADSMS